MSSRPGHDLAARIPAPGEGERERVAALSHEQGMPGIVLSESVLDLAGLALIPRVVALRHGLLPVAVDDTTVTLAVRDPLDEGLLTQVAFASGRQVQPLLAAPDVLQGLIGPAYDAFAKGARQLDPSSVLGGRSSPDGLLKLEIVRPDTPLGAALPDDETLDLAALDVEEPSFDGWDDGSVKTVALAPSILVVDDDDAIRALLCRVLALDGYEVEEAAGGHAALAILKARPPRLVVLDAMLPEVHGFQICADIKRSPTLAHVPVVMISAIYKGWELARDVHEVYGADRFIEKPFDVHYLRRVVAELLGQPTAPPTVTPEASIAAASLKDRAQGAYERGDHDGALELARDWARETPFDPVPWLLAGNVLHKRQDFAGALVAFERAATFGPDLFGAQKNLALVYERLGFVRRAFERWRLARQVAPEEATKARIDERLRSRFAQYL